MEVPIRVSIQTKEDLEIFRGLLKARDIIWDDGDPIDHQASCARQDYVIEHRCLHKYTSECDEALGVTVECVSLEVLCAEYDYPYPSRDETYTEDNHYSSLMGSYKLGTTESKDVFEWHTVPAPAQAYNETSRDILRRKLLDKIKVTNTNQH